MHELRLVPLDETMGVTWHELSKLVGMPEHFHNM